MKGRGDFKSQLISKQKPRKRRTGSSPGQHEYKIDLIELHRNIVETERQSSRTKPVWIRGVLFVLIACSGFALMGYLIPTLPIPTWAKVLLLIFIGALGFVLSHFVPNLFH